MNNISDKDIVRAYLALGTQAKVAAELGTYQQRVCRVLKRYGVKADGRKSNRGFSFKITDEELVEACKTMTISEISEKYGMHRESLPRRFKKLGIYPVGYHAGISNTEAANLYWKEHPDEPRGCIGAKRAVYGDCWHYVDAHKARCDKLHPDFEYLETRTTIRTTRIRLKCKKCGNVIERAASTFRQKNICCEACKERLKLSESRTKLLYAFLAIKEAKEPKTCKTCGGIFYSPYRTQIYCSEKCKRKVKAKTKSIRSRCRKYGVYYDSSVTRTKVFERDGYICQICGKPTVNDTSWGTIGPKAPTVDHIVALANGGTHTWGNVQCAHAICNSYKRDLWADEFEEVLSCLA